MANAPAPQTGQSWVKWAVIGVVVVLIGCGVWYAWGYFQAKGQLKAIEDATASSSQVVSPTPQTELEKITADGVVTKDELNSLSDPPFRRTEEPSLISPSIHLAIAAARPSANNPPNWECS